MRRGKIGTMMTYGLDGWFIGTLGAQIIQRSLRPIWCLFCTSHSVLKPTIWYQIITAEAGCQGRLSENIAQHTSSGFVLRQTMKGSSLLTYR